MGENINGPSLIRVPDWVSTPLGRYYLYFAHHKGKYIRMAYADNIEGPWTIYSPGVLDLKDSHFETEDITRTNTNSNNSYLYAHIASPDVHIDHKNKRFRMYFHGMLANADQQTRVAYSEQGLLFSSQPELLGPAYFRVFEFDQWVYTICWGGEVLRSRSWDTAFTTGAYLPGLSGKARSGRILRHCAVLVRRHKLHLFFSCINDCPEQIFHAEIDLKQNWKAWKPHAIESVIKPELDWEGAQLPILKSIEGASEKPCHELRDPCVFDDDESTYLLYCGAGECGGIGIARLDII